MLIRTKIVATIGPASGSKDVIRRLVGAGCDVMRINFSHGTDEHRDNFVANIRSIEAELDEPLAIMADLCGPKIRVGPIAGGSVLLAEGQKVAIRRQPIEGQANRISVTLAEMVDFAQPGQVVLIDDGKIRLEVAEAKSRDEVLCRVVRGGVLAAGKGVNLPQTRLKLSALTEKDKRDVSWIARSGEFDYVAQSFVRAASDVQELRDLLCGAGCDAHIIAKIETPQALDGVEEIIDAADAVMVARGDLGVEMDLPAVPIAQKRIARLCQAAGKSCIIATQMLDSMTTSPKPTRAEVSDVANAVLDHADAVMLSGETAVGKYPVEAVKVMNDIVAETQAYHDEIYQPTRVEFAAARTAAALAAAVREIAAAEEIAAVAVFTITGRTALMFAKQRLGVPILALSPDRAAARKMCLYYGVKSALAPMVEHTRQILPLASKFAVELGVAKAGEKIVVISGRPIGKPGATNTLVVHGV
ncbi:MAG: pyruvate kinase [Planctomycetota bacterium]|jgi:pyruvate kinase